MEPLHRESLHRAIQKWLKYNHRHTERTQQHYKMAILQFKKWLTIEKVDELKPRHIQDYLAEQLSAGVWKNRTSNAHFTVIQSFCRWASREYDISNAAANIEKVREDPPRVRVVSKDEFKKLLAVCKDDEADVILFLANTGLRASEFLNLEWADVREDLRALTFSGKGRKMRTIPLNPRCSSILSKLKRESELSGFQLVEVFRYRKKLYNLCTGLAARAGVPRFGPHALRHLMATRLMQKGVPIAKISKILGHSSVKTTEMIYIHWLPDDLDGVTDCLDL
ncbi:MAG: site-specific integrase [Phycisphaerae bacterium]|nr:site-specific integrase [Phycisphaerae bacterium]